MAKQKHLVQTRLATGQYKELLKAQKKADFVYTSEFLRQIIADYLQRKGKKNGR